MSLQSQAQKLETMQFNNKENPCLELKDGGMIWKSRNIAVCVILLNSDDIYLVKRGQRMTHKGLWCFPCGYLDWDETVEDAAVREVYEETGYIISKDDLEMIGIDSDPTKFSQNVTIRFLCKEASCKDMSHKLDEDEVEDFGWFSLRNELPELAFDHEQICKQLKEQIKIGESMGLD
jgi:ADP-ribose pyrophosphatase YjhB (NUDIX family)